MKCTKCGSHIEEGKVYCPVCGNEVRIVPDYNAFEEEIITEFIDNDIPNIATQKKDTSSHSQTNITTNTLKTKDINTKKPMHKAKRASSKLKKIVIFWSIVSIITVLITCSIVYYNMTNSFTYLYNKGAACENQKKYKQAISYYNKALMKNENSIDTRLSLAQDYILVKDKKHATSMLLSTLSIDKNNKVVYKQLLTIYAEEKKYAQIKALYQTAPNETIKALFLDYMVESPTIDTDPGVYHKEISLKLKSPGKDEIYYTLDGSDPIQNGDLYISSILLDTDGYYDVKAVCKNEKGIYSSIKSYEYDISIDQPTEDEFQISPTSGSYASGQLISITVPQGYKVYYTWDGTNPTTSSTEYTRPFEILSGNNVLSVIYVDLDDNISDIYRYNYICN